MKPLPKGTIIRIGQNKEYTIATDAVGVEFELRQLRRWGDYSSQCKVTKDPGGRWGEKVSHRLDPNYDIVIFHPGYTTNDMAARELLSKNNY